MIIRTIPDYSGMVYSPNPRLFATLLEALFGGKITPPNTRSLDITPSGSAFEHSTEQVFFELPNVGKWKISYGAEASGHIPLGIVFPIQDLRNRILEVIGVHCLLKEEGENHWRTFSFFVGTEENPIDLGYVHFANRG